MKFFYQSKSKTFFAFCFCFLVGIIVFEITPNAFSGSNLVLLVSIVVGLLILCWDSLQKRVILLCLLFLIIGIGRNFHTLSSDQSLVHQDGKEFTITGHVAAEPDVRTDGVRYILKSTIPDGGRVYLKSHLYPRYVYGDVLEVRCTIKKPEPIENFRYDKYLKNFKVEALCFQPQIHKVAYAEGRTFMRSILVVKNNVAQRINKLWHEPYASFVAGLLYGYRGGLGKLNEDFNRTGVTHIVAISGYNITIVSSFFMILLMHLSIPRQKAFYIAVFGIIVFTLFAGASASVVRAAIMGIMVLFARHMGRLSHPANALMLCATLMCIHNPNVLLWDAGFQLSFLATIGLVYINPQIERKVQRIPELLGIKESFVSTLSATLITLPLILFQFERLSVVSILVNILVLPVVPLVMYLGFATVLLSFISQPLALLLSWITWISMEYIVVVVQFFSALPFAAIDMSISFWLMIAFYTGILYFIYKTTRLKTYTL